ncbi:MULTISPECIES: phosphatidylcholine/phosphatidylserine synthase [Rhizobium/Agrobacterium group]|jgi:CDP-diacylglycerol--serine O-phosphatidyltransferase|uniref:CDP-diacylglycerol--serine O-phosphatidyltransferase n=1 Tax=Rhizobium soli TaxID=424798 RepID=A0A7X0JM02_9HYPH|nr:MULTISPECIES: phosphatidylcholine/phosphatidylserine synthase [Rhizobium/Agrobacterium group]KQQ37756.1 CDP-diacylglycerol--serine O-phosphatidyltransferase [Rhizobium sp. Leaf306]KQQ74167.1 CDP-diacylglycerol--serine O-phosphatidyltransferase [Rhizobium sp. Leaf321]MBB6509172.1 CDP-diacylglycerol--serine O-phosphatidyltransferase [Rhizobium soli]MBD8649912.1 phosphatidylcholine/phosphatidylserine synthase [Rhizobium sp. CFBP 13726]MBD8663676.1 phosphatidylcholine/phosphatidylserine synthas
METPVSPPEQNHTTDEARGPRLREIPVRLMIPNLITVLAICAGLTGIRLAFEGRFELAVAMVLLAAFLDGIDGRIARLLKATSKFGVQMDSLADIINFGVAPVLVSYAFLLDGAKSFGWIAALLYAIAAGLRLARFNVMEDRGIKAPWQSEFFVGVPAPMGALLVLLPVYLGFLGVEQTKFFVYASVLYTLLIGFLLVSRLPVWSGKSGRIRRDLMLPIMLVAVLYVGLLMSYTWEILAITAIAYLCVLPFSARAWKKRYGTITIEDERTHV